MTFKKIIKKKLRDLTEEEALKYTRCKKGKGCNKCLFGKVSFSCFKDDKNNFWYYNKELFSDEFLDQEIEIDFEIKLTEKEKLILKGLNKEWKYICRLKNGIIFISETKPFKVVNKWKFYDDDYHKYDIFLNNNHLFKFITWEDENPYLIEDLLKEE